MLGVTGPNEYENNVNNNFYTNYIAKWCMDFTINTLNILKDENIQTYKKVTSQKLTYINRK